MFVIVFIPNSNALAHITVLLIRQGIFCDILSEATSLMIGNLVVLRHLH